MHFSKRDVYIIEQLLKGQVAIDQLCTELDVSRKTIRNDILKINTTISDYQSQIEIDNGILKFVTIYSTVHWKNILKLSVTLSDEHLILLKLIFKTDYIAVVDLASELLVSKSKLEKMISSSPLLEAHILRKRNLGIKVELSNEEKIKLATSLILPYVDDLNYLVTSRLIISQIDNISIDLKQFNFINSKFQKIIGNYPHITDNESKIIFLFLLINETYKLVTTDKLNEMIAVIAVTSDVDGRYLQTIEQVVNLVLGQYKIEISNDQLYTALCNHILHSINRQAQQIPDRDLIARIESEYSYALQIGSELLTKLCSKLATTIAESEVYYIAIYIQTFINLTSESVNLKILIICQYGLSLSNYLYFWLKQTLGQTLDVETISVLKYWQLKDQIDNYDLVITTVDNLEIDDKRLVMINKLPTNHDKALILKTIEQLNSQKQFKFLLDGEIIRFIELSDIEDIYGHIKRDLKTYNFQFMSKMADRTREGLTIVNKSIVIHSDSNLATENKLLIYKLDKPIIYFGEEVSIIYVFIFTTEFMQLHNSIIKRLYKIMYSKHYAVALLETKTKEQFMWIFKNQIQGSKDVN